MLRSYVGCSGWYYWRWKNVFYPAGLPTHDWFKHYTGVFKTVELNGSFYHWPKLATTAKWRRDAPRGFRYAVKVNRAITHEKRLIGTKKLIREFYSIADTLGSGLGAFLFQFPPSFRYTPARLKALVTGLNPAFPNVIEFRHKSWWRPSVYRAFTKGGLIFCSVSGPRLPETLICTSDTAYIRFHGRKKWYRHDYSVGELKQWSGAIRASGVSKVWAFFNNSQDGHAVKNALRFKRILVRQPRSGKKAPDSGAIRIQPATSCLTANVRGGA
jgi:uncharacterized protein YecE (DUF72 family)